MKICTDITEVRNEIDRIDDEIVKLIAERGNYVRQAAKFKKGTEDVKAPSRVEKVITGARQKAVSYGADVEVTVAVYKAMINGFIRCEIKEFNRKQVT